MSDTNNSNFRFWVPISDISKAKDKDGKVVMRLGGIASTQSKDTDGENLDPSGFDISYLKDRGIVNWNHNKSPEAVIGEPTKAELTKKGLYIESELYPDNELACKVYELATTLKKNSKTRRLGYSIEGKATLRDPLNPLSVKKAMITNVALTISPKNPDSIVDIIKGNFHELTDDDIKVPIQDDATPLATDAEAEDFDTNKANGGTNHIIDITRKDGMHIIVDQYYNIKIDKSLSTDSPSGQAITRESLLGAPIILTGPENQVKNRILTKAEVINEIIENNSVITLEKAEEIYQTLNNLAMSKSAVTSDLLNKALTQIGISKTKLNKGDDEDINESEENEEEGEENPKNKKSSKKKLEKGEKEKEEEEEPEEDEEREESLNKFAHHKAMAAHHDHEAEEADEDEEEERKDHHEDRAKHHKKEAKKTKKELGRFDEGDEEHVSDHHKKAGLDEDGEEIADHKKLKRYVDKNAEDEDGFEEHEGETEEEADDDGIAKGLGSEAFVPGVDFFKSLGVVIKGTYDLTKSTQELVKKQSLLIKSQADQLDTQNETIEELKEQIEKSNDAIDDLSRASSAPKSVMNSKNKPRPVEREFNKSNVDEIEKSEDEGKKVLSISRNKKDVLNLLDSATFSKGFDDELAKALTLFESSGTMSQNIAKRLETEQGFKIVA